MPEAIAATPYLVLARKYRPATFADVKGQDALVRTLSNAIQTNRIAHAFLLTGIRGIGKTTTARIIARALNCIGADSKGGPTITPCGVCHHCVAIREDRHPDVLEMDAASRTGVNDIRELIENAHYLPTSARYKIYIIDEVHMLSTSAFNALLKTLEEPPAHVKFIFATTELRKIPITILSRCQRFDLRRLSNEEMMQHLQDIAAKEGYEVEQDALALLANAAEGSVRDGLSLLDQAIAVSQEADNKAVKAASIQSMLGIGDKALLFDLFTMLAEGAIDKALAAFSALYQRGADPALVINDLLEITHTITQFKITPHVADDPVTPELQRTYGKQLAEKLPMAFITRTWQMLLKGLQEIHAAPNSKMAAEMVLVRLAYSATLPSPAKIIQDIQQGKESVVAMPQSVALAAIPVQKAPQPPVSVAVSPVQESKPLIAIADFNALVDCFKEKHELLLYNLLHSDARLVHCEPGVLTLQHSNVFPPNFLKRVTECLNEWTGKPWKVTFTDSDGQHSIKEKEDYHLEQRRNEVVARPEVKEVLATFPEASIKNITFKEQQPA